MYLCNPGQLMLKIQLSKDLTKAELQETKHPLPTSMEVWIQRVKHPPPIYVCI